MSTSEKSKTIGESFKTEKRAVKVFEDWLPDDWLPRPQDPDMFIDYVVETVEAGEPSGNQFAAQIKGTKPGKGPCRKLTYAAETKHVRYWLEKCQHPVFIFLIDTVNQSGHWLFVQRYVREQIAPGALARQRVVTLRFSAEDALSNTNRFRSELLSAQKYVRDLHPGSPAAAIQKVIKQYEQKEPRLSYHVTATAETQTVHLSAKEPFKVNLLMHKEHAGEIRAGLKEALEHGKSVTFNFDKIQFSGSALFEEFNDHPKNTLTLKFGEEVPGAIVFKLPRKTPTSVTVDGVFHCGTKSATFRGSLRDAPVSVEGTVHYETRGELSIEFSFEWLLDRWHGKPLLDLPYFEQTLCILRELGQRGALDAELLAQGNLMARGHLTGADNGWTAEVLRIVEWIQQCRTIAHHYRANPLLPDLSKVTNREWEAVNDIAIFVAGGKAIFREPRLCSTFTMSAPADPTVELPAHGCVRFDNPNATYEKFGTSIPLGPLRIILTSVKMESLPPKPTVAGS